MQVSLIVRSQLEISERISSKGLSDPVLEPMLSAIPDPFDSYGPPKQDDQIFSILPPTSLLSAATSAAGAGTSGNAAGEYSQRSEALGSAIVLGLSGPSTTSGEAGDATTAASGALFGDAGDDVLDPSAPNGSVAGGLSRANEMSAGSGALDSRGEGAAGRLKKVLSIIDEDSAGLRVDTPAQRPEAEEVAEEQSEGVDGDEKSPTEQSEETTHANDLPTTSNADLPNGTEEAPSDTATNDVETANRSAAPPFDPVAHHEEAEAVEGDEGGDAADDPQAGEEGRSGRQEADASSLADETR